MALENGQLPVPAAPTDTQDFLIGGVPVSVPLITLRTLQKRREHFLTMDSDMDWITYSCCVVEILETALEKTRPEMTAEFMKDVLSKDEALGLTASFNELLVKSGFVSSGEAAATVDSPGTGTSEPSSQNSQQLEFAVEISTGS